MLADWRPIQSFSTYSVSSTGRVRNDETGRHMVLSVNQRGIVNVGLMRNNHQYKRSVGLLVADAFVKDGRTPAFNTPMHLDGDKLNNNATNLMWRPLWFARKYAEQLEEAHFEDYYPIVEVNTGEKFENPWDAARKFGLLQADIILSVCNSQRVWPTGQQFRCLI